jgi:hypothetical protein
MTIEIRVWDLWDVTMDVVVLLPDKKFNRPSATVIDFAIA